MQRRRFIQIAATAAGLSFCPNILRAHHQMKPVRWQGYTMGAVGQFTLYTEQPEKAQNILKQCFAEIQRLEKIFSLYDHQSELSRLNRDGQLLEASPELLEVLAACNKAHRLTAGLFDPTIQPLYKLYAQHFANSAELSSGPTEQSIAETLSHTGWKKLSINNHNVRFEAPQMSLTLNGIAQGYITDRISEILEAAGYTNVLVELGETRAIGSHPEHRPWQIGIQNSQRSGIQKIVELENQAVATSGSYGSQFTADGRYHHLIHPQTGHPSTNYQSLSVLAPTATEADALSTGLSFANGQEIGRILQQRRDLKIITA